jgi:hypothetical protein
MLFNQGQGTCWRGFRQQQSEKAEKLRTVKTGTGPQPAGREAMERNDR